MEDHKIILEIKKDGAMTAEVKGISGAKCTTASEWVNQVGTVTEDKHTDDFYKDDGQMITVDA